MNPCSTQHQFFNGSKYPRFYINWDKSVFGNGMDGKLTLWHGPDDKDTHTHQVSLVQGCPLGSIHIDFDLGNGGAWDYASFEGAGLIKLGEKQDELNAANNVIIAKEKENAESRKYIEANKLRISIASGFLAVACVAGAFFSPIFKDKLALGAALFGAISVGVCFLEPWHVGLFFAITFIGVGKLRI